MYRTESEVAIEAKEVMLSARDATTVGRREQGKSERKRRIVQAARDVFLERGYDEATTREIAIRAEVAIGTLFVYAADKRDLLFLVLNDELDQMVARALDSISTDQPLLDQLLSIYERFYHYFFRNIKLGRFALREMAYYTSHPVAQTQQALQLRNRMTHVHDAVTQLIRHAQDRGRVARNTDPSLLAGIFRSVYSTEIRRWLNTETPDVHEGTARLTVLFTTLFEGLAARSLPDAARSARRQAPTAPRQTKVKQKVRRLPQRDRS